MAVLKGSTVSGDLKVSGTIYGNISGNIAGCASCADKLNTDAGTNNQYAVYFSGGKPKAFTCKFGSAAWCNTSSFAAACHTHIANCITGGTKGQILYSDGAKGYWGNLSTTANSMADVGNINYGPWCMGYGYQDCNSPTYLTSWDTTTKTLRATCRGLLCVGCAGKADRVATVKYDKSCFQVLGGGYFWKCRCHHDSCGSIHVCYFLSSDPICVTLCSGVQPIIIVGTEGTIMRICYCYCAWLDEYPFGRSCFSGSEVLNSGNYGTLITSTRPIACFSGKEAEDVTTTPPSYYKYKYAYNIWLDDTCSYNGYAIGVPVVVYR